MRRKLAVVVALVALTIPALARTRAVRQIVAPPWQQPQCAQMAGIGWIRYIDSANQVHGADPAFEVLTPGKDVPEASAIAAATAANVLFATMTDGSIYQTSNAGCSWQLRARVPEALANLGTDTPQILAHHARRVYIHTLTKIVRLTGATVETFPFAEPILHVDVDPKDLNHLRAIAKYGNVLESRDGAATWTRIASAAVFTEVSSAATDPHDFGRMLVGTARAELLVSEDGGLTWTTRDLDRKVVHNIAFSPADSDVIWIDAYDGGTGAAGLYLSNDGGRTFRIIDQATTRLGFTYGALAPHPTDPDLVTVAPGLGTWVYSPDGLQSTVIWDNVRQVIWSPAGTMYYLVSVVRSL